MSLVPSFKKLNVKQIFIAKMEFLNIVRCITFCQLPYHVTNTPQFPSYSNLPGPSAPNHIYLNPSSPVLKFLPEHITIL